MEIIVSLTSHPKRIKNVHKVIKTLLIQDKKPDKIILWLSQTQFIEKEKNLPNELLDLINFGLIIRWCDDLKSHKKYYYVMQEFRDDIIITVDDDVYYSPRLIDVLYKSFMKYPDAVSCTRANRIIIDENKKTSYSQWIRDYKDCCNEKVFDLLPVGVGGVLYPPHSLPDETFDEGLIKTVCLYQDDLWLKAMEIKNNIPTVLVSKGNLLVSIMDEGIDHGLYNTINRRGNDIALGKIIEILDLQTKENDFFIRKLLDTQYSVRNILHSKSKSRKEKEKKFIDDIQNKRIIIYGAGIGARLVMESLLAFDKLILPYAFVVTDKKNNPEYLFNIPVLSVDELIGKKDEYYVIVSTAEVLHKEIECKLKKLNFVHIVYIKDKVMGKVLYGEKCISDAQEIFISSLYENQLRIQTDNNVCEV